MPELELIVRVSATETFKVHVEDDETVESLVVVIFSVRPALGEEMRLVHKGKILKPEQVLSEAKVLNGDAVAVAKMPSKSAGEPAVAPAVAASSPVPATTSPPPPAEQAAPAVAASSPVPATASPPPPAEQAGRPESPEKRMRVEEGSAAPPEEAAAAHASVQEGTEAVPAEPAPAEATQPAEEPAPDGGVAAPAAGATEGDGSPMAQENSDVAGEAPLERTLSAGSSSEKPLDLTSSASLLAFIEKIERTGEVPPPEKLAAALRETAAKFAGFEGAASEFGQALQIINHLSAEGFRNGVAKLSGEASDAPPSFMRQSSGDSQDSTKSYMIKKGDADIHEQHARASQSTSSPSRGEGDKPKMVSGGGVVSSSAPLSREEMAKARTARLAKLEQQQSDKKKELEEAEDRGKARDSLFNRNLPGVKPLGQPK